MAGVAQLIDGRARVISVEDGSSIRTIARKGALYASVTGNVIVIYYKDNLLRAYSINRGQLLWSKKVDRVIGIDANKGVCLVSRRDRITLRLSLKKGAKIVTGADRQHVEKTIKDYFDYVIASRSSSIFIPDEE